MKPSSSSGSHASINAVHAYDAPAPAASESSKQVSQPGPMAQSEIEHYPLDPEFQLRGTFSNPMVDAAMALFGLSIRLHTLDEHHDVAKLYDDVSNQIRTILEEIRQLDYDDASFKTYSYCLCLFMDETVMGKSWGVNSVWGHGSLLSEFHKETWGGEKFFTLLERMSSEAAKYQDVLEFMYFCVCLGLKGKYAVQDKGDDELQRIIAKLQRIIRELRGPVAQHLTQPMANVAPRNLRISRQWPWWSPWLIASALLTGIYTAYSLRLNAISQEVLRSLDNILKL